MHRNFSKSSFQAFVSSLLKLADQLSLFIKFQICVMYAPLKRFDIWSKLRSREMSLYVSDLIIDYRYDSIKSLSPPLLFDRPSTVNNTLSWWNQSHLLVNSPHVPELLIVWTKGNSLRSSLNLKWWTPTTMWYVRINLWCCSWEVVVLAKEESQTFRLVLLL